MKIDAVTGNKDICPLPSKNSLQEKHLFRGVRCVDKMSKNSYEPTITIQNITCTGIVVVYFQCFLFEVLQVSFYRISLISLISLITLIQKRRQLQSQN